MKRFFKWTRETGEGQLVFSLILLALVVGALLVLVNHLGLLSGKDTVADSSAVDDPNAVSSVSLTRALVLIEEGEVESLKVGTAEAEIIMRDDSTYTVALGDLRAVEFVEFLGGIWALREHGIAVSMAPSVKGTPWGTIIMVAFPIVLIGGMLLASRKMGGMGAGGSAQTFGQSGARMLTSDNPVVTFADVAGMPEAKAELVEVVEFLRDPDRFTSVGARIPRGVLLVGAPGTGKTLMAKAVSGEAGVPFFSISGSEFVEMFVGVGASRVRDLFDQAKRNSPCIVFIDEIDAIGRHRGAHGLGGSHQEQEQALNQILVEMDGFDTDTNVIVMAATNRPDILDPALTRPGRFDRKVTASRPDISARKAIFGVHLRGKPVGRDVSLDVLARQTSGLTGADIEAIVNEAAILIALNGKSAISMAEFNEVIMRNRLGGRERRRPMSNEERELTARHEGGHALVLKVLPNTDPIHMVTIVPRGPAGGVTCPLPEDRYHHRRDYLEAMLAYLLGGRAAEELAYGKDGITEGAAHDLKQATAIARQMVTAWGMYEELGPVTFGQPPDGQKAFVASAAPLRDYSEETAREIDMKVRDLLRRAYARAIGILTEYNDALEAVTELLLEAETIDGNEFRAVVAANS